MMLCMSASAAGLCEFIDASPSPPHVCATVAARLVDVGYAELGETDRWPDEPGRYALRVEGHAPRGTRPDSVATLPMARKLFELKPRIFIETLDGAGHVIFQDYVTGQGAVGVPGDAHNVITVASVPGPKEGTCGSPQGMELLVKPDVVVAEDSGGGGEATCFAAGLWASARSAGLTQARIYEVIQGQKGGVLRIPKSWLEK